MATTYFGRWQFVFHEQLYVQPGSRRGQFLFVKRVLAEERSRFQHIVVFDTEGWGRTLVLDGVIQTTVVDEFIYHESMVHRAIHWFRRNHGQWPTTVAVIGGGDGGVIREVLRYPVRFVIMREIDEAVVRVARRHLPELSDGAFDDKRLQQPFIGDGIELVRTLPNGSVDVLIVDSSDPVGPATRLFTPEFHKQAARVLSPSGVYVRQTGSPMLQPNEWIEARRSMRRLFAGVEVSFPTIPTYYGGVFSVVIASKSNPIGPAALVKSIEEQLRYLTSERMCADTKPPKFLRERMRR